MVFAGSIPSAASEPSQYPTAIAVEASSVAETVLQILMEAELKSLIGAWRHERIGERSTSRNGCRDRTLDTRPGPPDLRIP
mgnify:CR=1 FL=1